MISSRLISVCLIFCFVFSTKSWAQLRDVIIPSNELRDQSKQLTGDAMNWPVLTQLSTYNPEKNQFIVKSGDVERLQALKKQHQAILKVKIEYPSLIKNGAKVFASKELEIFDGSLKSYQLAQQAGDYQALMRTGLEVLTRFSILKTASEVNRRERVSAILADKTGNVFRRKGVLGSWNDSPKGELYEEADGVKTAKESFAKLDFTDGSFVLLNPETIAIIKQSTLDKLSNTTATEIQINSGGLLAALSNKSKQESNFVVKAADTETQVKSSKFWAAKNDQEQVSYSNYDGEARVTAASKQVVLAKDEGTIVTKGREPLKPVKLLEAPKLSWSTNDSITYDPSARLTWKPVDKASQYEIDLAPSPAFTYDIVSYESKTNAVTIPKLSEGTHFIRIRAYDALGLRGIDSPTYRLLKNKDTQAPAIFFKNGNEITYFTTQSTFTFDGITEPGSQVFVQGEVVPVKPGGEFSHQITLSKNEQDVIIEASDRSQNKTKVTKKVIKMVESTLFDLSWSVPIQQNKLKRADKITVSGVAYEPILVEAIVGGKTYKVECGSSWDWALQFVLNNATNVKLRFIHKKSGDLIAEKVFEIE